MSTRALPSGRGVRVLLVSALAVGTAATAPAVGAEPAGRLAPAASQPMSGSPATTLVLPTGQRVQVRRHGGRTLVAATHVGQGPRPRLMVTRIPGHTYAIPVTAASRRLDPSLFDVTALAALRGHRVPVRFDYTGTAPTVPGIAVTAHAAGRASGYVTSPAALGAAVRDGRLPGITHLGLATRGPADATPDYPQRTLTVDTIDPSGVVVDAEVATVVNTDDYRRYAQYVGIDDSSARVSVPTGHYTIQAQAFVHPPGHPRQESVLTATVQDVLVSPGADRSVTVDVAAATLVSTPKARTPRPARLADLDLALATVDERGQEATNTTFAGFPQDSLLFAPTRGARYGGIRIADTQYLTSVRSAPQPYLYELAFLYRRVPATGFATPQITAANSARIEDTFYSDTPDSEGFFGRFPNYPYDYTGLNGGRFDPLNGDDVFFETPIPGHLTEYVYGPDAQWYGSSQVGTRASFAAVADQYRRFRHGQVYREDWLRGLLAPGVLERVDGEAFTCQVCRTQSTISVKTPEYLDSEPGQAGLAFAQSFVHDPYEQRLRVFHGGTQLAEAYNGTRATFAAPSSRQEYTIIDTLNRRADRVTTSTPSTTRWTVRSAGTSAPALPKGWTCPIRHDGACSVLPLVTARLTLPTDLVGAVPQGESSADLVVGHVQGARATAITAVDVATSTDGTTFTDVPVTYLGGGRYRVTLTEPAADAGQPVSIRVHATDAAGGSITQDVRNAYVVAGS